MPRALGSLILILLGAGVLTVAWRGFLAGVLPTGSSGWQAYRPDRHENPAAFCFFFWLYILCGIALGVWGILALLGAAPALKLN